MRMWMTGALAGALLLLAGATMSQAVPKAKVRELGIPVKSVNWVRTFVGENGAGREVIYATMGQQGANLFVLEVDPETGKTVQHNAPATIKDANYPTASCLTRDGRLYVGAAYAGHLLRLDPAKGGDLEDLGFINPGDSFPCRIDEAPDGSLFIGCYGTAGLTRYDPKTGEFTRYGRMDETDMYCYPLVTPRGTVASLIKMTRPHVVLFDPRTGEKKTVGPVTSADNPTETVWIFRGTDNEIYIGATAGNYRIDGMEAVPVAKVPAQKPEPALSGGRTFTFLDADEFWYRRLAVDIPGAGRKVMDITYDAAGTDIFLVHLGPDGKIYGSSVLPLHLFRYDPVGGAMQDLGRCTPAGGEAYSMGNLGGVLYICSYPAALLSSYDPTKPYHYGAEATDNPRDLGPMDEHISYRPRVMLTGPLGRVWTGSVPNYGIWGGPLAWYDPATGKKGSYRYVLPDESSVYALAWHEGTQCIIGGTTISGGSGTQPKATQAQVFIWDPVREQCLWHRAPRSGATTINALATGPDGLVYGTASGTDRKGEGFSEIFVFDPAARKFVGHIPLPEGGGPHDGALQVVGGKLYGLTSRVVYQVDTAAKRAVVVAEVPGGIGLGGPIVGKTLYYAKGTRLMKASW